MLLQKQQPRKFPTSLSNSQIDQSQHHHQDLEEEEHLAIANMEALCVEKALNIMQSLPAAAAALNISMHNRVRT